MSADLSAGLETFAKVRALHDRTTNPGEKAAAAVKMQTLARKAGLSVAEAVSRLDAPTPRTPPDPIHAAIARHRAAYDAFQVAPEGRPSFIANDEYDAAGAALVTTACATRFGALALLDHLRWWLAEEAPFQAAHQPAYAIAGARAADLALFLGTNLAPVAIPRALPCGRLAPVPTRPLPAIDRQGRDARAALHDEAVPGAIEAWEAVQPVRPDTAHVRAPRFLDHAGEALTALVLIAGGVAAYGFLPFA